MTLGVEVIGILSLMPLKHRKYYLKDHKEAKILRAKLESFNLFEAEAKDIFGAIEAMTSELFKQRRIDLP